MVAWPANADAQLYGSNRNGDLFTVNTSNGSATVIAQLAGPCIGDPGVTEIEFDPVSGAAYAQNPNGSFNGFGFNILNGQANSGCVSTAGSNTGIETVNGVWYATTIMEPDGLSELRTLDPFGSGGETVVGPTGVNQISGLAYRTSNSTMYGIAGGPGPANLYTINLNTGEATLVGSTGIQAGSLQFGPDGRLYAGGTGPNANLIYIIDPATANSTLLGDTGLQSSGVTGLTLVEGDRAVVTAMPVPGMSAWGLLSLILFTGLIGVHSMRRHGRAPAEAAAVG